MGKAAVDLPDPLQASSDADKPRSLTSTDDLLAQLAGEEIDRLLAEVDDQGGAAAPAPEARRTPAGPSRPIELSGVPDPARQPADPPTFEDEAPAADAVAVEPDVTAELDAFFKTAVKTPEPAPHAAAPAGAAAPAADGPAAADDAGPADGAETSTAERAGLHAPPPEPVAAPATPAAIKKPAGESADAPTDDAPLPFFLKPLEWINAPMDACPSALRDFIGKAAIITLVNAAAVIAYVMLFRRR